jgi:hypothetical protein
MGFNVNSNSPARSEIDDFNLIVFMFIKVENWSSNPEQFVQDEDDESYSYSIRISAQELIEVIY